MVPVNSANLESIQFRIDNVRTKMPTTLQFVVWIVMVSYDDQTYILCCLMQIHTFIGLGNITQWRYMYFKFNEAINKWHRHLTTQGHKIDRVV